MTVINPSIYKAPLILIIFLSLQFFGQRGHISGIIIDDNNEVIPSSTIHISSINKIIYSNENGYFITPKIEYGKYVLSFYSPGYLNKLDTIILDKSNLVIEKTRLSNLAYELDEFEVSQNYSNNFHTHKMRAIEGVMITQGKKNELISLDKIDANKATNLSRQIYSKIPGLNIWESDGAGIQIGLGGRGLNPSRNSNFNTRQNGYDISADALGYPESYYTPPSEAIDEIQLIRGAASLQFGPQFGGLINYKLKQGPRNKSLELVARHTIGSFGLNNSYISLGGKTSKWHYYSYFNYKFGNDWRPNSYFDVINGHINIKRYLNERTTLKIEFSKMSYLIKQPGGLTDALFNSNPDTSIRDRNWFQVDWNLPAIQFDYEINSNTKLNSRTFGLIASRKALGYLDQINRVDPLEERNLIIGNFQNIGNETRLLHLYEKNDMPWAFVTGFRLYKGYSNSIQGNANSGFGPDFNFIDNINNMSSDNIESNYDFPSFNFSVFAEHIFNLTSKLSITPGVRYEYIATSAHGDYRTTNLDLAENIIFDTVINTSRKNNRGFIIGGLGINYKLNNNIELYSNFSQNYRSINFADMQIRNPNFRIDPILKDEKGFNADVGTRGKIDNKIYFDASIYLLNYNNRIGTTLEVDTLLFNTYQFRTNISESRTLGIETMVEIDWFKIFINNESKYKLSTFVNFSYNNAKYINSDQSAYNNKLVELVPPIVFKAGATIGNKKFSISYQYSYTQEHYSDATNAVSVTNAVIGLIPSYYIMDLSGKFIVKRCQFEFGINNLSNYSYFTRRAVAYPGPGIIPSAPRNLYLSLQIKI